jgi:hypothetical protein
MKIYEKQMLIAELTGLKKQSKNLGERVANMNPASP